MLQLNPLSLELHSRHLIEASAGTGKTFNITRLYARLILEKKLTVQQILVMTYTRAATEEIKGRIAAFLLEISDEWHSTKPSEFTQVMIERVGLQEGEALLTAALLSLDEASIFTIHGFCQRVLKQFAVSLNADLELELLTDSSDITMQSVQDHLRLLSKNEADFDLLVSKNWHIPDNFFAEFRTAISSDLPLSVVSKEMVETDQLCHLDHQLRCERDEIDSMFTVLLENKSTFFDAAVTGHKDELKRTEEWDVLVGWFSNLLTHIASNSTPSAQLLELMTMPPQIGAFINGTRYKKCEESKVLLEPLKSFRNELKKRVTNSSKKIQDGEHLAAVLGVVKTSIDTIRQRIELAKQKDHVVLFDDLISVFSKALQHQSDNLIDAIRAQFPVALVDEFQDTDRHQYQILDLLYPKADQRSLLLMIGDPKQAIYGFRGGDIFVYLMAKKDADHIWLMDTNWRSSAGMVTAYNRLFWGHSLDEPHARDVFGFGINYEVINSTHLSKAAKKPLNDPLDERQAMTYMLAFEDDETNTKKSDSEDAVLAWTANEIIRLLTDVKIGQEPVLPADIAILVKDRTEANQVKMSLQALGLTSVYLSDKTPLFSTPQAIELYRVLDAIMHPSNRSALLAGASSSLLHKLVLPDDEVGNTPLASVLAEMQADLMHPKWDALVIICLDLKEQWGAHGIFSLLLSLIKNHYLPSNAQERSVTNMMHLAEAIAKNAVLNKLPEQQLAWLSHQIFDHDVEEEMQLRLESDAELIKIVTQHGSKGLEYPIVFVPYANKYKDPRKRKTSTIEHFKYQDMKSQCSVYQLGATHAALDEFAKQEHAEKVRLLYVAVTRAEYRCYLGLVVDHSNDESALNVALNMQDAGVSQSTLETRLSDSHSGIVNVSESTRLDAQYAPISHEQRPVFIDANLAPRAAWIISSFSNLSRFQRHDDTGHYDVASPNQLSLHAIELPKEHTIVDADSAIDLDSATEARERTLRFTLEKGADTGNLLHDILENVDFNQADWPEASVVALSKFKKLDESEVSLLYQWLQDCLQTPLAQVCCLADLKQQQTLREAEFYFPMPGLQVNDIADVLSRYRMHIQKTRGFPAQRIAMSDIPPLSGMMHGFIDLIFEHEGKYYVADYKSTHLGNAAADYTQAALHKNNQHHLYDLQYLLYSLALHKYLEQQLPDYSFEAHFGGVFYLYLRGMSPEFIIDEVHTGVFFDTLSMFFLSMLDDLFNTPPLQEQ